MRSILTVLVFLISINLFAQHKIQVVGTDQSVSEYSLDDLENITFELENSAYAMIQLQEDASARVDITSETIIEFESEKAVFTTGNDLQEFAFNDITSIHFIAEMEEADRYPFGELEVDEVIVNGLDNPWSIDFIDNNTLIFTELSGSLFTHNISENRTTQIGGLPEIEDIGQGGLIDVTLDPDFASNKVVYLAYSVGENWSFTTAVGKGVLNGNMLENFEEIFRGSPLVGGGAHFGSRIIFDNEGKLYFAIGDRGEQDNAQDSTNHYGSVMRINKDGSVPSDNPYLDAPGAQPELYTMGNRNIQGMFYLSERDEIWAIEHGPRGGDELNLIQAGENYAWPLATFGINYDGTPITDKTSIPGYIDPITYWVPSVAPCGMDLIKYDAANNEIDIVIATLAGQHLHRLRIRNYEVVEAVRSLEWYARFRDIQMSPDGYLYAATQSPGRIIKLK